MVNLIRSVQQDDGRVDLYLRRPCCCFACLQDAWILSRMVGGRVKVKFAWRFEEQRVSRVYRRDR